jgi:hypothetical protein
MEATMADTSPSNGPGRPRVARLGLGETLATVATLSAIIVIFLIVALSVQMSLGKDPALGPKAVARPQPQTQTASLPTDPMSQGASLNPPAAVDATTPPPSPAPVVTSVS